MPAYQGLSLGKQVFDGLKAGTPLRKTLLVAVADVLEKGDSVPEPSLARPTVGLLLGLPADQTLVLRYGPGQVPWWHLRKPLVAQLAHDCDSFWPVTQASLAQRSRASFWNEDGH